MSAHDLLAGAPPVPRFFQAMKSSKRVYLSGFSGIFAANKPRILDFFNCTVLALLATFATFAALPASAQGNAALGSLFFTPKQRATLDAARKRGPVKEVVDEDDDTPSANPILRGFVKRSDGKTTVWLGRTPHAVTDSDVEQRLSPSLTGNPTNVILRPSEPVSDGINGDGIYEPNGAATANGKNAKGRVNGPSNSKSKPKGGGE